MTNYRYLGYGVTDSNGVAHLDHDATGEPISHSYTGVGAGEIDVVASLDNPVVEGSIVSGTLPVLDYLWYDKAIGEHKSSNYTGITVTVTDSDNGMVLSATADSGTRYCNTVIGGTNTWYDSSKSYQVEFDFSYEQQTGSAVGCGFGNNGVNFHNLFSSALSGSGHLKIITSGSTYQLYLDGTARGSPISITGTNGLFFHIYKTGSLTLSNISILEI